MTIHAASNGAPLIVNGYPCSEADISPSGQASMVLAEETTIHAGNNVIVCPEGARISEHHDGSISISLGLNNSPIIVNGNLNCSVVQILDSEDSERFGWQVSATEMLNNNPDDYQIHSFTSNGDERVN